MTDSWYTAKPLLVLLVPLSLHLHTFQKEKVEVELRSVVPSMCILEGRIRGDDLKESRHDQRLLCVRDNLWDEKVKKCWG